MPWIYIQKYFSAKLNLISLGVLEAKGCKYTGSDGALKVSKGAWVVMKAQRLNHVYRLIGSTSKGGAMVDVADSTSARVWHIGHGHMSGQGRKAETRGWGYRAGGAATCVKKHMA